MNANIEHIGLCAREPLALARWYVDNLDFLLVHEMPANQVAFVRAPGGGLLEIFSAREGGAVEEKFHPGLRHLAIAVEDCAAAVRELRTRGIRIPDNEVIETPAQSVAFFRDPEGNLLHRLERRQPLGARKTDNEPTSGGKANHVQ